MNLLNLKNFMKINVNNCDSCIHYCWYYDYCDKWECKVDEREIHECYEEIKHE